LLPLGEVGEDRLPARFELLDPLAEPRGDALVDVRAVALHQDLTPEPDELFRIPPGVRLEELALELRAERFRMLETTVQARDLGPCLRQLLHGGAVATRVVGLPGRRLGEPGAGAGRFGARALEL